MLPSPTSTDNESVSSPPVGNTQTVNETPDAFASNVTTDIQPPENSTLTSEPAGSTGELSSDNSSQVSTNVSAPESSDIGNTTSNLGNTTPNQFINNTVVGSGSTADLNTSFSSDTNSNATELSNMTFSNSTVSESNQTLSVTNSSSPYDSLVDPPLNTSMSNIFYDNISGDWVINQSGEYYLDLSILNNSGSGKVQYSDSNTTFSGFGSGFAILINATNVILNGMGAILNGNETTQYGIIVNNQTALNPAGNSLGPLGGVSITNITLTGFTQAGILFNNVIGNQLGDIASNITHVNASYNTANGANGIELQNSQNVEVNANIANKNGYVGYSNTGGIFLTSSSNNIITGNNATGNGYGGVNLFNSNSNTINNNNATGNNCGFSLK